MRDFNFFEDDDKFYVNFSIKYNGHTHEFNGDFPDDTVWGEILDEVVKTLEASYGYSFDLPKTKGYSEQYLGIYHKGRKEPESDG